MPSKLEYVQTNPTIERQLTSALVSQAGIKRVIGTQGAILPLPGMLRQTETTGEEVQLKAFALAGRRLTYDPIHQMFAGTIWLGVNEIVGGRMPRPLVTPVEFQILDADAADPPQVSVLRTASLVPVQLRLAGAVQGGAVTILSNLAPEPISLSLPVNPSLVVGAGNDRIEGLGLGTTEINVSVIGLDSPRGHVVTLQTSSGFLTKTRVELDENGIGSTVLRSGGLDDARVTAFSPKLGRNSVPVDFEIPYTTFLASILGGLVGGGIRIGTRRRSRARVSVALTVSVLLGILIFALYAVGVNVLPVRPSVTVGAALVFAVAGLGAFLGPAILKGR